MNRIFIILVFSLLTSVAASARKLQVQPGHFQDLYNAYELKYEGELELIGSINGTDVKVLREWAASWKTLNLKDCRIVAGGEPYYENYTTEDDAIGSYMFGDKELKKLVLPKDLKKIGDYAITFCGESMELPPTLTWLGDHAFVNNKFEQLHLPATLVHIGSGALNGNLWLNKVTIDENNPEYIIEDGYLFTRDHTRLLAYFGNEDEKQAESFTIRPEVITIDDKAFNRHRAKNITLNEGLEYIGDEAFRHALHQVWQKKLVIPSSVRYLAKNAFWNAYVDTLDIQAPLDSIPSGCFYNCESLKTLILPPTIKRIGGAAFYQCYRLKECKLPEGLEEIGVEALAGADGMVDWHIPASVRKIEFGAFFVPNYSAHNIYMYSKEPPAETDPAAFEDKMRWMAWNMDESVLYVPEGCIENYRHKQPWCDFGTIKEFSTSGIHSPRTNNKKLDGRSFDLHGRHTSPNSRGLRIIMTPNGPIKKI